MEAVPVITAADVPDIQTNILLSENPLTTSAALSHPLQAIVFKPIEAKFHDSNAHGTDIAAYCKFKIGWHAGKTSAKAHGGENPRWGDVVVVERRHDEEFAKLKLKDKNKSFLTNRIGEAKIDLKEVVENGKAEKWYKLRKDEKEIGEILVQSELSTLNAYY